MAAKLEKKKHNLRGFVHLFLLTANGLYVLFSIFAPVLMKLGFEQSAKLIYSVYSPMCHQFAFRSWFLFGEQAHYPLADSTPVDILPYEQYFRLSGVDLKYAQQLIGNSTAGFKLAICQRDIAIYSALFLFGLIFLATGKKIQKIPLVIWIICGVLPFAVDGLTQLWKYMPFEHFLFLRRESTPLVRTITGGMFGWFTGWYIFPAIQQIIDRHDANR